MIGILSTFIPDLPSSKIQEQALLWITKSNDMGKVASLEPDIRLLERYVLAIFYYVMNGDVDGDWKKNIGWLTDASVCDWYGIACQQEGNVVSIDLDNNGLSGTLPTEIGALNVALTNLNLDRNEIIGTVPTEIGLISNMEYLHLNKIDIIGETDPTGLTGTIPTEFGNFVNLKSLKLEMMRLRGTLPNEIGNLTALTWLSLTSNRLSGPIPSEMGSLTGLTGLYLNNNNFSGNIPLELSTVLYESVDLEKCRLGGNPDLNITGVPDLCSKEW